MGKALKRREKGGDLSENHARFAELVADGVPASEAAKRLGYSSYMTEGYRLTRLPHVAAAIRDAMLSKLESRAAPVALGVLVEVAIDPTAPKAVRVAASNSILDRAGYTARKAAGDQGPKTLAEMTADELASEVRRIRDSLQADADKAQSGADGAGQVIEIDP